MRDAASTAGAVEQKYGAQIRGVGRWAGRNLEQGQGQAQSDVGKSEEAPLASALQAKKKQPPPPPVKKAVLAGGTGAGNATGPGVEGLAPPVPMGSKPRPS